MGRISFLDTKSIGQYFVDREHRVIFTVLIVFGVVVYNFVATTPQQETLRNGQRELASFNQGASLYSFDTLTPELSTRIKNDFNRQSVRLGQSPSVLDRLLYETLEGQYTAKSDEMHVRELHFAIGGTPVLVAKPEHFLMSYKTAFTVPFEKVALHSKHDESAHRFLTYDLLDAGQKKVGSVQFETDLKGLLYSLKVQPTTL